MGITTAIIPSALDAYWWTVPVLVLSAIRHGIVEEVIVVGYLLDRLGKLGWSLPLAIFASAMLRGSYHLYQGFGPFIGNAIMGVIFALVYTKTRRLMPLVIAHAVLDIVAFVGFSLFGKVHRPGLSVRKATRPGRALKSFGRHRWVTSLSPADGGRSVGRGSVRW